LKNTQEENHLKMEWCTWNTAAEEALGHKGEEKRSLWMVDWTENRDRKEEGFIVEISST